jgi:hypothetical protein
MESHPRKQGFGTITGLSPYLEPSALIMKFLMIKPMLFLGWLRAPEQAVPRRDKKYELVRHSASRSLGGAQPEYFLTQHSAKTKKLEPSRISFPDR